MHRHIKIHSNGPGACGKGSPHKERPFAVRFRRPHILGDKNPKIWEYIYTQELPG